MGDGNLDYYLIHTNWAETKSNAKNLCFSTDFSCARDAEVVYVLMCLEGIGLFIVPKMTL